MGVALSILTVVCELSIFYMIFIIGNVPLDAITVIITTVIVVWTLVAIKDSITRDKKEVDHD